MRYNYSLKKETLKKVGGRSRSCYSILLNKGYLQIMKKECGDSESLGRVFFMNIGVRYKIFHYQKKESGITPNS